MAFRFVGNRFVDANDPQFDMYNALGRNGGQEATGNSDNFFVKRGKSIGNAFGTTGAALYETGGNLLAAAKAGLTGGDYTSHRSKLQNQKTENLIKDNQQRMQDIVKKYGYNSLDDYYDALDAAEAKEDKTEYNNLWNTVQKELINQADTYKNDMSKNVAEYNDYVQNNGASKLINQDPGKFAGSAINTLSTMTDVMLPGAGIGLNAIQGVAEGYADELEQSGFQNFDWNRANQNALIGGVTGGVTGAFNKGLSNSLAKNGGNLFKGGNRLTNWMNETGAKHPIMATLATGAGRGALSGAVGGATGGGLSAQLNGGNFLEGAARGAVQGAQSGAVTGATMAGANMALNATPGVGKVMRNLNQAGEDWKKSGSNFNERLTNTLTSGDSVVGDWLMNKRQSNVLDTAGSLGNRVQDVSDLQTMLTDIRQRAEKLDANRDDYGMPDESWRSDAYGYEELLNNPQTRKVIDSLELTHNPTVAQAAAITQYLRDNGYLDTPTTAKGWLKKAGQRIVEDINNSNLGNRIKDTSLGQYENDPKSRIKLISEIAERAETLKRQPRGKYGTNSWDNDLFEYRDIDERVLNTLGISEDLDGPRAAAVTQVLKEKGIIPNANTPTTATSDSVGNRALPTSEAEGYYELAGDSPISDRIKQNVVQAIAEIDPEATMDDPYRSGWDLVEKSDTINDLRANLQKEWGGFLGNKDIDKLLGADTFVTEMQTTPNTRTPYKNMDEAYQGPGDYYFRRPGASMDESYSINTPEDYTRFIADHPEYTEGYKQSLYTHDYLPNNRRGEYWTSGTDTPATAKGWLKKAGERIVEDVNNSNLGNRIKDVDEGRIPLDESMRRINNVRGGEAESETIGKLPLEYMYGETENPNIEYISRIANEKIMAGDAKNLSVAELAYSTNNYNRAKIIEFDKNGTGRLNIVRPIGNGKTAVIALEKQPNGNTLITTIRPNASSNYVRNLTKNKGANVLYDTTGEAATAFTTGAPAASRAIAGDTNRIIPQVEQNVNDNRTGGQSLPQNTPETEVYRTLTGESEQPSLAYGESELGNRTRRGMVADSLERFGNTLEGAQTNVTRAAAKDLGIESAGRVVENVRKKTGITNLETQAKLAKELTGGDTSLMDNIQRQALNASESGKPYKVDTTPILGEVDAIVDKYADTNMFGSTTARNKFISNLKRDISNFDSDVLSIANRMKANAADLRGKGVASPTPADSAKAKIYTEIANKLDDLSYKAIPQENVEAMFDATISEMRGRANQAKQNGNNDVARAYTKLADSLNSEPRTIKAFRSFKKDFVDISKISELTNRAENGAAVQMGRGFGGGVKRFLGTVAQRPVNATLAKAGGAVNELANKIAGEGTPTSTPTTETTSTNYNPATQVYNAIGRTEGATNAEQTRTANYLANAVQNANTLEDLAGAGYTDPSMSVYNSLYGEPTSTSGDYWTGVLSDAMEMARKAGDATAFGQLYSMYQDAVGNQAKTTTNKLTDKQRQANAAARALDDMMNAENNFAYDISDIPIIGGLANMTGNDYKAKAEALALQVGYMLSGATVNAQEAKNIGMAYVPQPRENETERKRKLAQLREIISDYQQTYAE